MMLLQLIFIMKAILKVFVHLLMMKSVMGFLVMM